MAKKEQVTQPGSLSKKNMLWQILSRIYQPLVFFSFKIVYMRIPLLSHEMLIYFSLLNNLNKRLFFSFHACLCARLRPLHSTLYISHNFEPT